MQYQRNILQVFPWRSPKETVRVSVDLCQKIKPAVLLRFNKDAQLTKFLYDNKIRLLKLISIPANTPHIYSPHDHFGKYSHVCYRCDMTTAISCAHKTGCRLISALRYKS